MNEDMDHADLLARVKRTEVVLNEIGERLDKLLKGHIELFDAHLRLLKSYNDNSAYVAHELDDQKAQTRLLLARVAPEQLKFQQDVDRILKKE